MERNTDGLTHSICGRTNNHGLMRGGGEKQQSTPSPLRPVGLPMGGVKQDMNCGGGPPRGDSDHGRPLSDTDRLDNVPESVLAQREEDRNGEVTKAPMEGAVEAGLPTMSGMIHRTKGPLSKRECCGLPGKKGHGRWMNKHGMGYWPRPQPKQGGHGIRKEK